MKSYQRGAVLIVVLIVLLMITVIGTMAVRQSMTTLNIATNSQADQLLTQNSDSAFFNIERQENLIQALSSNGMFQYTSGVDDKEKELVFCFRGAEDHFFDIKRASIIYWKDGEEKPTNDEFGKTGYCDVSEQETNFFTSGRRVVMTQVSVKFSSISETDPFYGAQFGTDEQVVKFDRSKPVKVFAVSLMPTISNADTSDINACLNSHMSEVVLPEGTSVPDSESLNTVTECLQNLKVPYSSHVSEYVIVQDFV